MLCNLANIPVLLLLDAVQKDAQSRAEPVFRDKQVRERNIRVHLHHIPR